MTRPPLRRPAAAGAKPRVLFAAAEMYPLVKIGGLADAAGALCLTLSGQGVDARAVLPAYRTILERMPRAECVAEPRGFGGPHAVRLLRTALPDTAVPVYLIDAPALFDRPGSAYQDAGGRDWPDNALRFALCCRAVEAIALGRAGLDWTPEIVHCNDWHTGLAPALLSRSAARPRCVFTIHNLAYQGNFPRATFDALQLPADLWSPDGVEFHGMLSFIKGGLAFADALTTVSPTHAREITSPEHGFGLDGLLRHRHDAITGILNGVDYRVWDPRHDPHIARGYWTNRMRGKRECKLALQEETGLRREEGAALLAHVARLTHQKGTDLILAILDDLLADPQAQLLVLGAGDAALQDALRAAAAAHPGRVAARVSHDEALAHRIFAGADLLLMPSRYEPCGLTQLYALRYGTLPVVHRTGGLADTIVDLTDGTAADGTATGFQFDRALPGALREAVRRALRVRRADPGLWTRMQRAGMHRDFGWDSSAARYAEIYARLLGAGTAGRA